MTKKEPQEHERDIPYVEYVVESVSTLQAMLAANERDVSMWHRQAKRLLQLYERGPK